MMMTSSIAILIAIIVAYLFGSVSSAIIVCKMMGLPDPRREGSLNPGATNVLRIGGKKAAAITLLGDALKGLIPVLAVKWLGFNATGIALTAFAAFLGHLYPIFFSFEGGKGIATLVGVLLGINLPAGLCFIATWIIVAFLFKYSSVASMSAATLAPLYLWYFTHEPIYVWVAIVMTILVFYRHRSNIKHLMAGTEGKLNRRD